MQYINARLIIFLIILLLIDLYAFQAFRVATRNYSARAIRTVKIIYWLISGFCIGLIAFTQFSDWSNWNIYIRTYGLALLIIFILPKIILAIFVLFADLVRLLRFISQKILSLFKTPGEIKAIAPGKTLTRSGFIIKTGLIIASIPFFSMIYGMAFNPYNYKVRRVRLILPDLPDSFEGFRIIQVSDIHTGSFLSTDPLERAVNIINEQKPDVVFFIGDLVNNYHKEAISYVDTLKRIEAKHGVFSIFGNHDYGDYHKWNTPAEKENDILGLKNIHSQAGWKLLWDEHQHIEQNGEKITIIGVQNCSAHGFSNYGSLEKATKDISYSHVNILLSHDPSHWRKEVTSKYPKINLTLSGHTHGMQFGVEIPGFKWSPVQYLYKEWAGMYQENDQYLYVNRGLGFIGYPGRVGILPEITVIELKRNA
jgi:predicted MPP superfamily phosphohydrolase